MCAPCGFLEPIALKGGGIVLFWGRRLLTCPSRYIGLALAVTSSMAIGTFLSFPVRIDWVGS